ncbi:TPA: hypothetical protein DDW35_13165 [Candidatus Sumerlaeota bacterium]|jgi:DNA-binding response OmpR family regulator|nr:hypothetical protein [Candidatus Sumerlaeota bacterium]
MAATTIRVLLIEDNPAEARIIERHLVPFSSPRFELVFAERLGEGLEKLTDGEIDVVLLDLTLPDSSGTVTFERLQSAFPALPIVVLTGLEHEELGEGLVHAGAQDYLVKGQVSPHLLSRSLRYAIERKRLSNELQTALHEVRTLSGLLPICASCKKVRDDKGYWNQIESYLQEHSLAQFTHSFCPECLTKLYPTLTFNKEKKTE